MFRMILSATAFVSVVVTGLSFSARTQACPAPMPQTLLWLYQNSDEVHLATYSRSVDVGIEADEEGHSQVSVRRFFDISSTLKGESKKSFAVDQFEYRSKRTASFSIDGVPQPDPETSEEADDPDEVSDEPTEEQGEEEAQDEGMRSGSPVLLFLTEKIDEDEERGEEKQPSASKKDEKPELILTSQRDGIRWIADGDIGVYESRIKELNSIFSDDVKDRDHQLIEWMIRCMENNATRWDGAYELDSSFESLDRVEAAEEYEGDEEEKPWVASSDNDDAAYARLMTRSQMDRVSNILVSPGDTTKNGSLSGVMDGEDALIALVERWAGPDVAKFLLQRLRDGSLESYETNRLMTSIAMILGADELTEAGEAYGEVQWEDDDEIYEEEDDEEETEEVTSEEPAVDENSPAIPDPATTDEDEAKKPRQTVREVRAERLAAFIALTDAILARPEVQVEIAIKIQAAGRHK